MCGTRDAARFGSEVAAAGQPVHYDLTGRILEACFEVSNELGPGFLESVYQHALVIALRDMGLRSEAEVPLRVCFRGCPVGQFAADIVVEGKVMVELKAVRKLAPEHQAQLINYLNACEVDVGLLVNFGARPLDYKRCHRGAGKRLSAAE